MLWARGPGFLFVLLHLDMLGPVEAIVITALISIVFINIAAQAALSASCLICFESTHLAGGINV